MFSHFTQNTRGGTKTEKLYEIRMEFKTDIISLIRYLLTLSFFVKLSPKVGTEGWYYSMLQIIEVPMQNVFFQFSG